MVLLLSTVGLKESMPDSKDAVKADLGVDLQGSEEVLDEVGEGGDVSHTQRCLVIQEDSENPCTIDKKLEAKSEFVTNTKLLPFTRNNDGEIMAEAQLAGDTERKNSAQHGD